ncbi:MAG: N-acetylmuramoyl-L-alanine amidase, partial [Lentisphaerae bacterium]|nr:N-acetylmuramoyl-L-alanine amidase [Lentisphaerota bacterium]
MTRCRLNIPAEHLVRAGLCLALALHAGTAAALDISNRYSPRNRERDRRRSTDFIILHTTEGGSKGSIEKIRERGEAHYVVDVSGKVYRIIDKSRVAYHAGLSMWDGRRNLDLCSLGIEVVGYHYRDITGAQYRALAELLGELQRIYRIPDERVLTHCMVAYGAPNRWHKEPHRGRKRCGLVFAQQSTRRKLGLDRKPAYDPDVRAGRLVEADPYLARILYGNGAAPEGLPGHGSNA